MDESSLFLDYDGLDDHQVRVLRDLLHPSNLGSEIEFPWSDYSDDEKIITKGCISSLNIHAPAFESYVSSCKYNTVEFDPANQTETSYYNGSNLQDVPPFMDNTHYYAPVSAEPRTQPTLQTLPNNQLAHEDIYDQGVSYSQPQPAYNGHFYTNAPNTRVSAPVSTFKLNPTVSSFVPHNYPQSEQPQNGLQKLTEDFSVVDASCKSTEVQTTDAKQEQSVVADSVPVQHLPEAKQCQEPNESDAVLVSPKEEVATSESAKTSSAAPSGMRSWADIVSRGQKSAEKVPLAKVVNDNKKSPTASNKDQENDSLSIDEDKMSLALGKHLYDVKLNFQPLLLTPRGLINRRNWCYINATLQALLACSPFYTLVRNLPLGPTVERGKSSTPVIDSMVKLTYEFIQSESAQEEVQPGTPFQPDFIYDMLRDLKSDCLKGQQEDAEEFLSFILNGMHEEMVKIIKNYEKKNNLDLAEEFKENGDVSDGEEEWKVIGSKHRGMVTRKVVEHKTPISELLGGQIKSFLTTGGNKTSASIQPFFTLQLDIQSENVNSVSDALKEMTVKEPIQGYTCAKTKQEVEAYSHIALQKLPPILILHLKRFVYNKNGGCKKVMKKTDYPIVLELSKDMFSADLKKNQKLRRYKLFAVMYHDGEEAVKGHYISDVFNHGSQSWIRCDDRAVTSVNESEVLSHSPPRVPYLLFYQES